MGGPVRLRAVYLARGYCRRLPPECCTLNVTALLRELILHTVRLSVLSREDRAQRHVLELLLDQIREARVAPLQLPVPRDERAARVARALLGEPAGTSRLEELARRAGASARTIERCFRRETGLSFHHWRQRLRALHALRLLAAGKAVNEAAVETGYSSTSAFIAMFQQEMGTTPRRYFSTAS